MSQENVEVVRQGWKAFTEGGIDATLDYYAQDCVCEDFPELPDAATSWEDLVIEPVEFIDAGDQVVVSAAMRGHGRGSDTPMDAAAVFVYEVRDGRIVRDRAFRSRTQALEAAGLRE